MFQPCSQNLVTGSSKDITVTGKSQATELHQQSDPRQLLSLCEFASRDVWLAATPFADSQSQNTTVALAIGRTTDLLVLERLDRLLISYPQGSVYGDDVSS